MKKFSILHYVLFFNLMLEVTCTSQHNQIKYCGEIMNQTSSSSLLNNMTLCRSHKLYFRTSLGLFKVTSIDYNTRTLTIAHSYSSSSSSLQFVSPLAVTAGFPSPPESDSLLLFNCSIKRRNRNPISPLLQNCRELNSSKPYECLVVKDVHEGFHPGHLNCSNYMWVHKIYSDVSNYGGYKLGTRISFDIPDHVPDLCKECEKPHGNCGAGLKCLCHSKECKDEILSSRGSISSMGNIFSLLSIISVLVFVMGI